MLNRMCHDACGRNCPMLVVLLSECPMLLQQQLYCLNQTINTKLLMYDWTDEAFVSVAAQGDRISRQKDARGFQMKPSLSTLPRARINVGLDWLQDRVSLTSAKVVRFSRREQWGLRQRKRQPSRRTLHWTRQNQSRDQNTCFLQKKASLWTFRCTNVDTTAQRCFRI